jgi:hypothetical protein
MTCRLLRCADHATGQWPRCAATGLSNCNDGKCTVYEVTRTQINIEDLLGIAPPDETPAALPDFSPIFGGVSKTGAVDARPRCEHGYLSGEGFEAFTMCPYCKR